MSQYRVYISIFVYLLILSFPMQVCGAGMLKDTVHVRGSDNYPPFEFINDAGQPDGFNVEIFHAVMNVVGQPYTISLGEWDEAVADIHENGTDALLGMIYSAERAVEVRFCLPHCTINRNIISRKTDNFSTLESLRGRRIAVQHGSWSQRYIAEHRLTDDLVEVPDMSTAIQLLDSRSCDAAFGSDLVALYVIKTGDYDDLSIYPTDIEPQSYSIVVSKDNEMLLPLINNGLQQLKVSGEYDRIYNKWFGVYSGNTAISRKYYQMLALGLGLIALLVIIAYVLRAQVRRATRKLTILNADLQSTLKTREEVMVSLRMAVNAAALQAWHYDIAKESYFKMDGDGFASREGQLTDALHPQDRDDYMQIISDLIDGRRNTANATFRFMNHTTGKYHFYEMCFIAVKDRVGVIYRIVINLRDITRRHLHQLEIETARRSLEMAMGVSRLTAWEFDLATLEYNILYGDIYQKASVEEFDIFIHPDDRAAYRSFVQTIIEGTAEQNIIVVRMRRENLQIYGYLECNMAVIKDRDGVAAKLIGSFRDISEQKRYEAEIIEKQHELEIAKERAERSDRLKSAFLANMSHEIRTPLNAIVGFSELILTTEDRQEREEFFRLVTKNNNMLLKLINDIFDISKIESGNMDFNVNRLDFAQFFCDVASIIRPSIPSHIDFICEHPYQTCMVEFDEEKAMQMLGNLLANAIKFTSKGWIRMGYECREDGLEFYVADSGIGIAPEDIPKIFGRFEKVDNFTQGTGLGMSLCKALVDNVGGRIDVESNPGQGSTFRVWIPCRPDPTPVVKS